MRDGLNPFEMQVPVLGPPWKIPFEFPLFQLLCAVVGRVLVLDPAVAGRLVATVVFALAAAAVYLLARSLFTTRAAVASYVIFAWSAYGFNWGSEVLIDYLSVALCISGLVGVLRTMTASRWTLVTATGLSALGALTKVTTAYPWVVICGVALAWQSRQDRRRLLRVVMWMSGALVPAVAWNRFADSVKGNNPHTEWLTSWNLNAHHFRSPRELLEASQWRSLIEHATEPVVGSVLLAVALTLLATITPWSARPSRLLVVVLLAPPLTFTGLYLAHDYYFIAVSPALAILGGVGTETVRRWIARSWHTGLGMHATVVAALVVVGLSWISPEGVENLNNSLPGSAAEQLIFEEVGATTTPEDHLLVVGMDWSPVFLYTVDRKGLMLRPEGTRPDSAELGTFYEYVYWAQPNPTPEQWAEYFPAGLRHEEISPNFHRIFALGD
jgi:4-amino-4-deoxy-L-arabinose transferase-like glycosyltransferase